MLARKKLDIPQIVSGRPVSRRGVHLQPFGHHGDWLNRSGYWVDLLVSMGISWVVLITDGDSVRQSSRGVNPLKVLLDAGIIPIIREGKPFPLPFTEQDTFRWTVDLYGQYGLKPFWIIRNEPFDPREWLDRKVPADAWHTALDVWTKAAAFIARNGGYVGFPDGPSYRQNPFESIKARGCQWIFDQGSGFYAGHHYGKNRPRDYPYDAVTRYGAELTEEAYLRLLDDFGQDRTWREESRELINQRRTAQQSSSLTALHDDTCWRGWEKIAHWSLQSFGYVVPMAMTEGGWVPRDRPGSGPNTDIRMPHTTPRMVAKRTLQMYGAASPFFALCPWLLADEDMGGVGWPYDAWHGWAYSEKYGVQKPVISALQAAPAQLPWERDQPLVIDLNGDTRDWAWIEEAYGAAYQRGTGPLRLIEVHEYDGPESLDVWLVDRDGLPVEGVEFCCHHPQAPDLEAVDAGEWRPSAVTQATGPDGRLSFPVGSYARGAPGAGQAAIWPAGRGDILEGLGLLDGPGSRRLNGLWQAVDDGLAEPQPPTSEGGVPRLTRGQLEQVVQRLDRIEQLLAAWLDTKQRR